MRKSETSFYLPIFTAFFCLYSCCCIAETKLYGDSSETEQASIKHQQLTLKTIYGTNSLYKGRTDGAISYILPSLRYKAKSGFNIYYSAYVLPESSPHFDESDLSLGWDLNFTDNWDGSLSFSHYFFSNSSTRIRSAMNNVANVETGYYFDWFYTSISADYTFNSDPSTKDLTKHTSDYSIDWFASHTFEIDSLFGSKNELDIEFGGDVLFGTQNFITVFSKRNEKKAFKKTNRPPITNTIEENATKFNPLYYELSLDISYYIGRFKIEPSLSYIIPTNVEPGFNSSAYTIFTLGLSYKFNLTR